MAAEPADQAIGLHGIACNDGCPVSAQGAGECRGRLADHEETSLKERVDRGSKPCGVGGLDHFRCEDILLEGVEPAVDDLPECRWRELRGREVLSDAAIDGLELVERCLGLADLHLGRCEPCAPSPLDEPPREERLACPVLAAHRLEYGATG